MTSHDLLRKWSRERDELAFRELVHRHAPMVFATSKRILRDDTEAQDVTQECFETLATTRRLPDSNLGPWLHRVATNRCLDRLRTTGRRAKREIDFATRQLQPHATGWNDIYDLVDQAIAELPDKYRAVIIAHFLEGRPQSDIANELHLTRQAIHERLNRGIEAVRAHLKRRGIEISAATLTTLLAQHASAATIPVTLTVSLGKLALTAHSTGAVGVLGGFSLGKFVTALVIVASVVSGGWVMRNVQGDKAHSVDIPGAASIAQSTGAATSSQPSEASPVTAEPPSIAPGAASSWPNGPSNAPPPMVVHGRLKIEPETGASISGTVVRSDGRPYPDAKVTFEPITSLQEVMHNPQSGPIVVITCDADQNGHFHKAGLKPNEYSIQVTPARAMTGGKGFEVTRVTLKENEHRNNLRLVYGGEGNLTITGTVINSVGETFADVTVSAYSRYSKVRRAAVTDKQGRFTLVDLPESEFQLSVNHMVEPSIPRTFAYVSMDGHATAWAGSKDVQILMPRLGVVEGHVVHADTGAPITSYKAYADGSNNASFPPQAVRHMIPFVNAQGKFRIPDVQPGDVRIVITAEGFTADTFLTHLDDGATLSDLVFKLSPGISLTGRVVDEQNRSVSNAEIRFGDIPDKRLRAELDIVARSNEKGEFRIRDLPKNLAAINVYHAEFGRGAAAAFGNPIIVLRRSARLAITVTENGRPVVEAPCNIRSSFTMRPFDGIYASTDHQGFVLMEDVLPGWMYVTAYIPKSDRGGLCKVIYLEPGSEDTLAFDFQPATTALEGIASVNGVPVESSTAFLRVDTGDGIEEFQMQTTSLGAYWFDSLPAGSAEFRLSSNSYPNRRPYIYRKITLEHGRRSRLDLELNANSRIEGRVFGLNDAERVVVHVASGSHTLEQTLANKVSGPYGFLPLVSLEEVDGAGTYSIDQLEPGDYTVYAIAISKKDHTDYNVFAAKLVTIAEGIPARVDFEYK